MSVPSPVIGRRALTITVDKFSLECTAQAAVYLPKDIFSPNTAHSLKPEDAPLSLSYGFKGPYFEFIEAPGNERHLTRFTAAMASTTAVSNPNTVLEGSFFFFVDKSSTRVIDRVCRL